MCGIFGIITANPSGFEDIRSLARNAEQRGKDSSGLLYHQDGSYKVIKADFPITRLLQGWSGKKASGIVMGHSRLITNGLSDNQPVIRDGLAVLHNGIIVNNDMVWEDISRTRQFRVDSEVIVAIACRTP